MENNSKGDSTKIKIELLLRKALRVKQKPSQQLNDSIIRQCEKRMEQRLSLIHISEPTRH